MVTHQVKFVTTTVNIDGEAVDETFSYLEGDSPDNDPWAIELFAMQDDWGWSSPLPIGSQRILTKPLVIGGVVYFTTFVPDENICAGNGETWLHAVDYQSGQTPDHFVFEINPKSCSHKKAGSIADRVNAPCLFCGAILIIPINCGLDQFVNTVSHCCYYFSPFYTLLLFSITLCSYLPNRVQLRFNYNFVCRKTLQKLTKIVCVRKYAVKI